MRIIVLDGNENQAVACVRSLARAGHQVVVGAPTAWSKAGWSRYCERTFIYPAPDVSAFVECIVQEARREPGALVMPMTERTTLPLSAERERVFAAGGRPAAAPPQPARRRLRKRDNKDRGVATGRMGRA